MYSVGVVGFGLALMIWLGFLSYIVWKDRIFLRQLFPGEGTDIRDKFQEVLNVLAETHRRDQILNRNLRLISREGLSHLQKIAVLRYNPYADTGGDQSFSIALLNGVGSGILLTSLHTRNGTRVYTKSIKEGKCDLKLSKEEVDVVEMALTEEYESTK